MKTITRSIGIALLGGALVCGCAPYSEYSVGASVTSSPADYGGGRTADFDLFYRQLSPYGHWFEYGSYGWCWTPYDRPFGWRPYSDGYWTYSDAGWTWVSNEPFGWATCHYGRWLFDADDGWVWVPGDEWGPAWVAWRESDDWVGWAPLPPAATWQASAGLSWSDDDARQIDDDAWCFAPAKAILDASLQTRIEPAPRNRRLIDETRLSVRYDDSGGHPRDLGLDEQFAARVTGHPVPHFELRDEKRPQPTRPDGRTIPVFRPQVLVNRNTPPPESNNAPASFDPQMRARQEAAQHRLEAEYQARRQRLEAEQQQEEQQHARDASIEALRRQHAEEMQALEAQRERARHVMDTRYQKGMVRGADHPGRGRGRGRDPGNGQGNGPDKGHN